MKRFAEYNLGDMLLVYTLDEENRMSMMLIPAALKNKVLEKPYTPEPLVQIHARGDICPTATATGIHWPSLPPRMR